MAKEANQLEENKAVKPSSAPPDNAIKNEKTLKWIETTVAILLGITTLLSAAATWIGSLHHGIQSINFTKSNNMAAQGNSEYNMGMQLYLSDYMTWNVLKEYYYELDAAKENGNQEKVDQLNERIKSFQVESASAILSEGIQWREKINEDNPFKMPGMTEKYFESAQAKVDESQELLEEGKRDNTKGDSYNLVTVIYSLTLFLLGIIGTFKNLPNRLVVLFIAFGFLVFAVIYMFTIPLPTGFEQMDFFNFGK